MDSATAAALAQAIRRNRSLRVLRVAELSGPGACLRRRDGTWPASDVAEQLFLALGGGGCGGAAAAAVPGGASSYCGAPLEQLHLHPIATVSAAAAASLARALFSGAPLQHLSLSGAVQQSWNCGAHWTNPPPAADFSALAAELARCLITLGTAAKLRSLSLGDCWLDDEGALLLSRRCCLLLQAHRPPALAAQPGEGALLSGDILLVFVLAAGAEALAVALRDPRCQLEYLDLSNTRSKTG